MKVEYCIISHEYTSTLKTTGYLLSKNNDICMYI